MVIEEGDAHDDPFSASGSSALLADPAPVMIWVTEPDGRCSHLSETWYAYTGQTPETALGAGWLDATHPDDRERTEATFRAANELRQAFRLDYRLRRHDGEYRWAIDSAAPRYASDGTFLGYVGSVIDITDRKEAEQALRGREARFRTLFHAIDEGYCLCEMLFDDEGQAADYRFLETNALFSEMTGLQDAVGRTAYELVPDLEPKWVETYARVALDGDTVRFEQGSDAMGRWFDVFAMPVEPRGCFALVFKDITAKRAADAELRAREARERRVRGHAELLAEIAAELETVTDSTAQVRRLLALLVSRVADYASVEVPARADPVVALRHRNPDLLPVLETLRRDHRLGEDDAGSVARAARGESLLLADLGREQLQEFCYDAATAALLEQLQPRSHIAVPLELGAQVNAALLVGLSDGRRRPWDADDLAFFRRLGERAGVIFARSRVREEEHKIALRLQQALLPDSVVAHPAVDVCARYVAASDVLEVGGDWYDSALLPDGRIALAVGDVVGHGLDAAAAMGRMRTAMAALAPHADGPAQLLDHLDAFCDSVNGAEYATACCMTFEPEIGRLRYSLAGHPPPLLVDPDGQTRWLTGGRSVPLLGPRRAPRPEAGERLAPGSMLVLYSDGLVERRDEPLDRCFDRLARTAVEAYGEPAERVCDRLIQEVGADDARADDIVIVCFRVL